MLPDDRSEEIEELRAAVRERLVQTSFRQLAKEIGISHGGVHNFVHGAALPYGRTLAKLRSWYWANQLRQSGDMSVDTARALMEFLLAGIPRPLRDRARHELVFLLADLHRSVSVEPPDWIKPMLHDAPADLVLPEDRRRRGRPRG